MFRLTKASIEDRERLLLAARDVPLSCPHLLTLKDGSLGPPPKGFVHDFSRSEVGRGPRAFVAAREAFLRWEQINIGWVRIADQNPKIIPGELVALDVYTAGLWSINLNRIVEIVDSPTSFGFIYTTTVLHVEEGQERFVIEIDAESESVLYLIEAISRPRHILARFGYPLSRAMQHRFTRDSHARMRRSIRDRLIS